MGGKLIMFVRAFTRPMQVVGVAFVLGVLAFGAGPAQAATLDPALCAPSNSFSLSGNDYFPLDVNRGWALSGVDEGRQIGFRVKVLTTTNTFTFTSPAKTVVTREVQETEWLDSNADGVIDGGETLIEESINYFAKAGNGTVCYFGEIVNIFGAPDPTMGSWRADDPGAAPGIQMPAAPQPGMEYAQENKPGVAEDRGKIVGSGKVTVPAGTFTDTVRVRESNPLEGGKGGYKVYARGVGLIQDGTLNLLRFGPTV